MKVSDLMGILGGADPELEVRVDDYRHGTGIRHAEDLHHLRPR